MVEVSPPQGIWVEKVIGGLMSIVDTMDVQGQGCHPGQRHPGLWFPGRREEEEEEEEEEGGLMGSKAMYLSPLSRALGITEPGMACGDDEGD
ncbi:hypothetical protein WISP_111582 [Willisornis vidua]|uniref:Uncharacterized protein n=1 Tax=Willisornis vidua TaxID=1566151 RepID=A0ABQ9D175_9PASS|nr:hypothetical protein WISP_111582 [Willisornis vidua]